MKTIYSSWQKLIGARCIICYIATSCSRGSNHFEVYGRQVFGGIPENDLKGTQGRRAATLAGLEDVELHEKPKRPTTAVGVAKQVKVGY